MGVLKYPLDGADKAVIDRVIDDVLSEKILDTVWNDFFYYLTLFEDIENGLGLADASVGGSGATYAGMLLKTGATSGNETTIGRDLTAFAGTVTYDQPSRFRTTFNIQDVSAEGTPDNQTIFIGIGLGDSSPSAQCYGFRVTNTTLYGLTCDGSAETAVQLLTGLAFETEYTIEARLTPSQKVLFYVNEKERGVSTTNIPTDTVAVLPRYSITTNEATAKQIQVSYFEYIQRRPQRQARKLT